MELHIGHPKAEAAEDFFNQVVPGMPIVRASRTNVLDPSSHSESFREQLGHADLIVDMAASVAVSRALCEEHPTVKRISIFLNQGGTDLVVLSEAANRAVDLWDLEATYYAAVASQAELSEHLRRTSGRLRYGNGCRDRTATFGGDQVKVFGAIAARQLLERHREADAYAAVWSLDPDVGEVRRHTLQPSPSIKLELLGWRIRWSSALLSKLRSSREDALPSETGGVLMGLVDQEHKVIVICNAIAAPPDSEARPYKFERGTEGLGQAVHEIGEKTLGQIQYIGEWHSHPEGHGATPSGTDEKMFAELKRPFAHTGDPLIMAIFARSQFFTRLAIYDEADEQMFDGDWGDIQESPFARLPRHT